MDAEQLATIVGNAAIALSFVVALVFGIAQVRADARDRKERLTIETIRAMQTREMAAHFHRIRVTPPPKTMAELYAMPAEEQISLIQFSQEMEMLGLLVYDGVIEIDLVERTLGDFVKNAWEKSRPPLRADARGDRRPLPRRVLRMARDALGRAHAGRAARAGVRERVTLTLRSRPPARARAASRSPAPPSARGC
jgi:hypothetical protein